MDFNIIVGNPPYGVRTANTHLKVMRSMIGHCTDRMVLIMPSKPVVQQLDSEWYDVFTCAVCTKIDIVAKDVFAGTDMENTAIYNIDRRADKDEYCRALDVDENLYNSLSDECRMIIDRLGAMRCLKIYAHVHGGTDKEIQAAKRSIRDEGYYLNISRANGSFGALWFSDRLKALPVMSKDEEIANMGGKVLNVIHCPTAAYAENLKKLLNGPVLRFGLWVTQSNRFILDEQLKYVPDLDFAQIDSDEELLSACGFTDVEITQVIDYLKDFDFSKNRNDLLKNGLPDGDAKPVGYLVSRTVSRI